MFVLLSLFSDWAVLILRVVLGAILVVHGWPKIKDLKKNGESFNMMGFRPGIFWGTVAAIVEFFGGLLVIAGLYAQLVAFFVAGEFLVINVWKWSKHRPFVGGFEFDILILAAAVTILTLGAGLFSLDHFLYFGGF